MQAIKYLFFFFLLPNLCYTEMYETYHMNELHSYLAPQSLVIFDIDNTLIEPAQELGNDQWFNQRIRDWQAQGLSKNDATQKALREWTAVQSITKVKLVEPGAEHIVENLQLQGFKVMGLTTRGLGLATRTVEQLESVGIDLHQAAPSKEEHYFINGPHGVLFRGGVLFTAGTHKGEALRKFLAAIDYVPEHVLFINDKASHIKPIEEVLGEMGIPFAGLRYGFLDQKVKNFRKQIAEVQFHYFGHIMTDEAAERELCPLH